MTWSHVRLVYARELKSALREPTVVVNSVLLPIFLYPVLLWLMFSALTFAEGLAEGFTSRVAVVEVPRGHATILSALDSAELVVRPLEREEALEQLAEARLDAVLEFVPPTGEAAEVPGNFALRLHYDQTSQRSERARQRAEDVLGEYRRQWVVDAAARLEIPPEARQQYGISPRNVASGTDMGSEVLGRLIPLFLVIMVALGCTMPAIDTTAGERERSTWETLMTASVSRTGIVVGKYLHVATLGFLAGLLNVIAVFASIGAIIEPLLAGRGETVAFEMPLLAVPIMLAGAVSLALFFGAAMMILASFARTFKDGQALVTPVFWLALLPLALGQQSDQSLTPFLAAVPVAGVAMMVRDAVGGVFLWPFIAITLVTQLVAVAGCLLLARAILRFEDFVIGAYDGSFFRFVRERLLGRPPGASARG